MKLVGLHHVTMITGDAQRNVDFYADVLGLRLVKTTVNFDDPTAYHLYFGDEQGAPGSILTWFEYQGARNGQAGAGMIHTIQLGVPSLEAIDFWAEQLAANGYESSRGEQTLRFADWEGLGLELAVADGSNPPLGFDYLGDGEYLLEGSRRRFRWAYDRPSENGRGGAGTVHHIAWATEDEEQLDWQQRIADVGGFVTPVQDRDYFLSIYFREPRGVLFEIATLSPGFAIDEDPEHLGEELRVPQMHAHLREQLEQTLTPLVNPRSHQPVEAGRRWQP